MVKQPKISVDAFNPVSKVSDLSASSLRLLYPLLYNSSFMDVHDTFCDVLAPSDRWKIYHSREVKLVRADDIPLRLLHHPLPVPHPLEIVLVIYKREMQEQDGNDDALDFDNVSFRQKLRYGMITLL